MQVCSYKIMYYKLLKGLCPFLYFLPDKSNRENRLRDKVKCSCISTIGSHSCPCIGSIRDGTISGDSDEA